MTYFLNVASEITNQISSEEIEPASYIKAISNVKVPEFKLELIDEDLILGLLSDLDHLTATGHDGIPARFIKLCRSLLSKPLMLVINRSLMESKVPSLWKRAIVTPIHKGGATHLCNYGPISVLPAASKILKSFCKSTYLTSVGK